MVGREVDDGEDDGHHQVRAWRRKPLVVEASAPSRLVVGREDVIRTTLARIEVRRDSLVLVMDAPLREFAAAIVLAIESELLRPSRRKLEALVFLEVFRQEPNCLIVRLFRLFD